MQRVLFGRLWMALKRTGCLQQMFKMMPIRLHACTHAVVLSIDQRSCRWCSAECSCDAVTLTVTWKARHFRDFTSEQNKLSKSSVVEKVIPVADFW